MAKLTQKQNLFCIEYLKDFNVAQSALRAGYSPKTARQTGHENLTKPNISEKIRQIKAESLDNAKIDLQRVLNELGRIAFCSIRGCIDASKSGIVFHGAKDIPDDLWPCISEIAQLPGGRVKIKLYSKTRALDSLLRYFSDNPGKADNEKKIIKSPLRVRLEIDQ